MKKRKKGRRIKDTAALSVAGFSEEDYSSSSSRWELACKFGLLLGRNRLVAVKLHGPAARALREGVQAGGVAVEFGKRHDAGDFHQAAGQGVGAGHLACDGWRGRLPRSPMYMSGAVISMRTIGSRIFGWALASASRKALRPAATKATSFESTGWLLPS